MNWMLWIITALMLAVVETLAPGFFLIFFALGAFITAIVALWVPVLSTQLVVFLALSVLSLLALRPWLMGRLKPGGRKSNIDRLPGEAVLVLEPVTRLSGRVKVLHSGEVWSAYLDEPSPLSELLPGESALVVRVDGAKLVIAPPQGP